MSSKNVLEEGKNEQPDQNRLPGSSSRNLLDASTGEANDRSLNGASDGKKSNQHKRGWREIEALRERKALKEMLAEIWDDDFDLDDSIFGEPAENASLYRKSSGNGVGESEAEDDDLFDEDAEIDDFYDEDN